MKTMNYNFNIINKNQAKFILNRGKNNLCQVTWIGEIILKFRSAWLQIPCPSQLPAIGVVSVVDSFQRV